MTPEQNKNKNAINFKRIDNQLEKQNKLAKDLSNMKIPVSTNYSEKPSKKMYHHASARVSAERRN